MGFDEDKMYVTEEGFGLLLGAGASYQAGYPMMDGLTRQVLRSLDPSDAKVIASIVKGDLGTELDVERAEPNIEVITDLLEARMASLSITSEDSQALQATADRIRASIVRVISSQERPQLQYHVRLFQALKQSLGAKACSIWVFTTNYDLLVEWGAAMAGLPVYDGFCGSSLRFFDINSISLKHGSYLYNGKGNVFVPAKTPQVNLIKLHGSINWWVCGNNEAYSSDKPPSFCSNPRRALVLPRKSKVRDILEYPFESLWRLASEVIGRECRYITSVGFGYGDQHIKERLLLPKMRQNEIALTALLEAETEAIDMFKGLKNFQCATEMETPLWDFRAFVKYVCSAAGCREEGSDVELHDRQGY